MSMNKCNVVVQRNLGVGKPPNIMKCWKKVRDIAVNSEHRCNFQAFVTGECKLLCSFSRNGMRLRSIRYCVGLGFGIQIEVSKKQRSQLTQQ